MNRRRKMLETMAATDMLPYVRYSRASIFILCLPVLVLPVAMFSTTLLYILAPVGLMALLFFNLTFIALGSNYIPTEELLDKEAENNPPSETGNGGQRKILTYSRILRMINQGNCRLFQMNAGTLSSRAWMPGVRIRATRTVT